MSARTSTMLRALRVNPAPIGKWTPPKPRYVGQAEGEHPAFRAPRSSLVLIWDVMDTNGEPVPYEPTRVMVRNGGQYYFDGLRGLDWTYDDETFYGTQLHEGSTQEETIAQILNALDQYPTANRMPPALFHGVHKLRSAPVGSIHISWGVAPESWLR